MNYKIYYIETGTSNQLELLENKNCQEIVIHEAPPSNIQDDNWASEMTLSIRGADFVVVADLTTEPLRNDQVTAILCAVKYDTPIIHLNHYSQYVKQKYNR